MPSQKEFPLGKENYCPRCYFDDNKVILRKDCLHNQPSQEAVSDLNAELAGAEADMNN